MLHSEMLTRKAGAETTVPFFPLENWHVPIKVHSTPSLMEYNLGFEIFELYIYGSQNNSRIIINLVCRAQNKPWNTLLCKYKTLKPCELFQIQKIARNLCIYVYLYINSLHSWLKSKGIFSTVCEVGIIVILLCYSCGWVWFFKHFSVEWIPWFIYLFWPGLG